jgi:hypothetical protein
MYYSGEFVNFLAVKRTKNYFQFVQKRLVSSQEYAQ